MELGLHAGCIMHTNVVTDIRIAKSAGYDAIELWIPKLKRYLEAGYRPEDLLPSLENLRVTMLDCVLSVERQDADFRKELLAEFETLCSSARSLGCSALQLIALDALKGLAWPEMRQVLVNSFRELADLAAPHQIRLAIEPVVFSPFNTIQQVLEVFDAVERDNLGMVVDTWHIWTAGVPWEDVAALDSDLIVCAHISDTNPKQGLHWHDDDRTALPGDGILPLKEGVEAIQATGYDGVWSVEMLSHRHWEWDPEILSQELKRRTEILLGADS